MMRGDRVSFWDDKWLRVRSLKLDFPNLYRLSVQKNCSIQEVISRVNGQVGRNVNFWRNLNDWEIYRFARLMEALQSNYLNFQNPDKMRWIIESSCTYTVKSFASSLLKRKG